MADQAASGESGGGHGHADEPQDDDDHVMDAQSSTVVASSQLRGKCEEEAEELLH